MLMKSSTAAARTMYTRSNKRLVYIKNGQWRWKHRDRFQKRVFSKWLQEDEVSDSFLLLSIDVFHGLWESYHPGRMIERTC